jgi:transposase
MQEPYLCNSYHETKTQMLQLSKELRHQVKKLYPDIYKRLLTVPGIGPTNAICLIAEIGDMRRFKTYRQLASFAGLVPRSHQSGETDHTGSLTYRNNKYLLSSLIESSWMALRYDPALMIYYKERVISHKSQVVITKVAHKLLNRIRSVWISGNAYQLRVKCITK